MPAPVVLVHDDAEFRRSIEAALRNAGIVVASFASSMSALEAVEQATTVQVLVTRGNFPAPGDPNGVSLVLVGRLKRPGLRAIFICSPESAPFGEGVGVILQNTATPSEVVEAVQSALEQPEAGEEHA